MNSNTIKMKQLASIFFLFAVAALPVTASSSSLATNIRGSSSDNNRMLEQSTWGNDGYNSNTGTSYHGGYYTQTSSTASSSSSSGGGTSSKPKKVSAPKPKPKPAPKPSAPSPSASSPSTPSSMSTHTNWDDDAWKDDNWGDTWKDDTWEDDTWGDFAHEYGQEWHRSSSELAHNNGHGSRGAKLGMMFSLSAMIALAAVLIVKKVSCEKM